MAKLIFAGGRLLDFDSVQAIDPEPNAGGVGVSGVRVWFLTGGGLAKKDYAGVTVEQAIDIMQANGYVITGSNGNPVA